MNIKVVVVFVSMSRGCGLYPLSLLTNYANKINVKYVRLHVFLKLRNSSALSAKNETQTEGSLIMFIYVY